jgi:acyl carrier protein
MLGRTDFQVKLRGMRVELAEVEHALRRAPGVRDAVASAKDAADGEKILVAYVVTEREGDAQDEKSARMTAIRRYLSEQLPDYMVPAAYVELAALPLNHNLKIDRRALPEPQESDFRALSGKSVREPRTLTESTLAYMWRKLLGVERVGLDDNFFELGGHSMLAVMLSLEVEEAFGFRLEGMDILREPLEILASICDRRLGSPRPSESASGASSTRESIASAERVEIFYFGRAASLYGVMHGQVEAATRTAVLICGPVGQEQVRARFVLSQLAKRLALSGIPSLIFDYFGCGDSLGDSHEVERGRWQADIVEAYAELARRVAGARVRAVGVRLGALLLGQVAPELELDKLVFWDPVRDGAQYFEELRQMQNRYLRGTAELGLWRRWRDPPPSNELLGTRYARLVWSELSSLALPDLLARGKTASECLELDCGWHDVARLEDVIPDVRISSQLASLVLEEP